METPAEPAGPHAGGTTAERAAFAQSNPTRSTGGQHNGPETDVGDRARNLASDAVDRATEVADSLRERVVSAAGQQQDRAADAVDAVADSLNRVADQMPQDQAWLSDLTVRGGQQLSELAETIRQNDLQGLLRRVDGFARDQPALFLGASLAAGFALARVAQASIAGATRSSDRPTRASENWSREPAYGAEPRTTSDSQAGYAGSGSQSVGARPDNATPQFRSTVTEGPLDRGQPSGISRHEPGKESPHG
jgi:hypothetical protein